MVQSLIFDLDGTIWNTSEAYLYAYEKLCELFPPQNKKNQFEVQKLLGLELNEVLSLLTEFSASRQMIKNYALKYTEEYLLMHPQTYSKDIISLFSRLFQNYDIYIVSHCPKRFLDNFFKIFPLKKFVKASFTIEDGSKKDVINKIMNQQVGKSVFIGDNITDYTAIEDHKKILFCYASYGYFKALEYDFKIKHLDEIEDVLKTILELEKKMGKNSYEIVSEKDTKMTLIYKQDCIYFSNIFYDNLDDLNNLIIKVKKKIGFNQLIGPIEANTWYSYRISLNMFKTELYPDCINDSKLLETFLKNGFEISHHYISTLASINQKIWARAKKIKLAKEYHFQIVHKKECYTYLDEIYQLACLSFLEKEFYEEISFVDFKQLYMKNINLCSPDLVLIYHNKELVAFNFCYEDLQKRFYVCKTTAIHPKYRSMKLILKLIDISYQMMSTYGYQEVLYHFQSDQTKTLYPIFKDHIVWQKKYGLLRYENEK